ncbi:unnamed protein product [Lampetra planeri]
MEVGDVGGAPSGKRWKCAASGSRFKLLHEGDVQVCAIRHARSAVVRHGLGLRLLRRWEAHHIVLADGNVASVTCDDKSLNFRHRSLDGVAASPAEEEEEEGGPPSLRQQWR